MARVTFYKKQVIAEVNEDAEKMLLKYAYQIEGETKVNIMRNGQIDTGFMMNSVYTVTPGGMGSRVWPSGEHGGQMRVFVDPPRIPKGQVAVGVGASYAYFQEMRNSFLVRAFESVLAKV